MKIFACIFFLLITVTLVQSQDNQHWMKINSGNEIPDDAVGGGKDGDGTTLFVARGNYEGGVHPGKTRKDWNGANLEYGGNEITAQDYEVLVGNANLSWSTVSGGSVPGNAVNGGQEGDRVLYVCRCQYEGSMQLGKTWQGSSACNIGYGGGGFTIPVYDVLVSAPKIVSQPVVILPKVVRVPVNPNAKCFPREITNNSQKNVMSITYDNNNHATGFIMTGGGVTDNYTITSDAKGKILSIVKQGAATGFTLAKATFTYDQTGRVVEDEEFLGASAKPTVVETFTYNSSGQLTGKKQVSNWVVNGKENISYGYNVYSYPNTTTKNPNAINIFNGNATGKTGTPQQIKLLTYDDKKNIGGAFPGTTDDYETFATNNVISADVTFVTADVKETLVITYEYNEAGYPTTKTYKANGGLTFTDTYTYQCSGSVPVAVLQNQNTSAGSSVTIGTQVWSSKNLDVKNFANGDPIDQAQSVDEWIKAGNELRPAWCYYENDPANGILYNWFAVGDPRGLAPKGWHVPTKAEWITMLDFLGGKEVAGTKLKSRTGWEAISGQDRNGTDDFGFTGLPGGLRFYEDGKFDALGSRCQFWNATKNEAVNSDLILLGINSAVTTGIANKKFGYSVRSLKD